MAATPAAEEAEMIDGEDTGVEAGATPGAEGEAQEGQEDGGQQGGRFDRAGAEARIRENLAKEYEGKYSQLQEELRSHQGRFQTLAERFARKPHLLQQLLAEEEERNDNREPDINKPFEYIKWMRAQMEGQNKKFDQLQRALMTMYTRSTAKATHEDFNGALQDLMRQANLDEPDREIYNKIALLFTQHPEFGSASPAEARAIAKKIFDVTHGIFDGYGRRAIERYTKSKRNPPPSAPSGGAPAPKTKFDNMGSQEARLRAMTEALEGLREGE